MKNLLKQKKMRKIKLHFFGFVCFSNLTSPSRSPIDLVPCVPFYTFSSPVFKGMTRGMSYIIMCKGCINLWKGKEIAVLPDGRKGKERT